MLLNLISYLMDMLSLDRLFALRTVHEGKSDPKASPPVFQELHDTVGVEDVPTAQLNGGFLIKLARVANIAQLAPLWQDRVLSDTLRLQAGKAPLLVKDTLTPVTTFFLLTTEGKPTCQQTLKLSIIFLKLLLFDRIFHPLFVKV